MFNQPCIFIQKLDTYYCYFPEFWQWKPWKQSKITSSTNFEFFFPFWRNFAHKKQPSRFVGFDHQNPAFSIFVARIPADFNYLIFLRSQMIQKKGKSQKKIESQENQLKLPDFQTWFNQGSQKYIRVCKFVGFQILSIAKFG